MTMPPPHPDRIATCFKTSPPNDRMAILLSDARFTERLSRLVDETLAPDGFALTDLSSTDRYLLALPIVELIAIGRRAGIVVNGRSFTMEISGAVISLLEDRFGAQAFVDARANRDLAGTMVDHPDPDALEAVIVQDGMSCVAAWIDSLPDAVRHRIQLAWPTDSHLPVNQRPELAHSGPQILQRLVHATQAAT